MRFLVNIHHTIFKTSLQIEKRIRFVMSAVTMSVLLLISTLFYFDKVWFFIPIFVILVCVVTYFSVLQGIEKVEWLTLFLMPVLLTVAFYLFYLLFPIRWITRLPFIAVYAFSLYAVLLTSNIFNVGAEKSLQLYRAAFSVNYFYHTLVLFLTASVIFSFRLNPLANGALIFVLGFLMSNQLLWSVKPKIYLEKLEIFYSILISVILLQVTILLSFVPMKLPIFALFITAVYYSLSGILYHHIEQKLFSNTIREYLIVIGFVTAIALLSIQW